LEGQATEHNAILFKLFEEFGLRSRVECSRGECNWKIGEIKRWVRRMSKVTRSFGSPFQEAGAAQAIRSSCSISERTRLKAETEQDMMMSE